MRNLIILCLFAGFAVSSYAVRCADFSTQQEAQEYMERTGDTRLDDDRDGEACECLLGGTRYGSSICRKSS